MVVALAVTDTAVGYYVAAPVAAALQRLPQELWAALRQHVLRASFLLLVISALCSSCSYVACLSLLTALLTGERGKEG